MREGGENKDSRNKLQNPLCEVIVANMNKYVEIEGV